MPNDLFKRLPISLAVLQALAMWSNAYALPTGEAIQAGQATFQHNGNTLRIDQSSAKAIVNWQSFNIQSNEAVNLFQPNHGAALFRILGPEASQIFGSLTATGSLFLSNPNGILFAPGSRVDVGSLVATTMRINNADFMSGNYQFYADPNHPDSSVINQGVIRTTDGGYLVLLGNKVENSGSLQANNGSVVLGSAESAVLDFYGDGLVKVNLSGDALNAAIEQTGNITANGGAVQLAANARTAALNVDGVIQANSLVERNGVIRLEGGTGSKVKVTGTLQASGKDEGTTGGNVTVSGEQVALLGTAVVDASGQDGGGTALIGGDYQGKNASVQNARTTYISNGTIINADATKNGDGGKVVVWSDNTTRYYGNISAQGGMLSGNGGFVEVSGKQNLDFLGGINVGAAYGSGGRVLLDPQDILLNTSPQPSPANNANGSPDIAFADAPAVGTTTVQIADITGFSELFLQATRDITIANAITMATNNSIRLEANNDIVLNNGANLKVTGAGSINLKADADASGAGALTMNNATLTSQQGGITLSGASIAGTGAIATTGAANQNGGNVLISSTGAVNLGGAITANGGTASAGTPGRNGGAITINANGFTTTGTITASGNTGNGADSIGGNAGSITINSTNGVSTGTVTTNGGNAGTGNANGGTGGTIAINNTTSGAISVGAVNSRAGNSIGTGTSLGGSVALSNTASGDVATGAITTSGNNNSNAHGGTIQISSATGNINVGALVSSAGTVRTGNSGKDAGAITINSGGSFTGTTITANGSISNGASQNGGNGAAIDITSAGGITATTVTASGGNAAVTDGNGGSAGSITMSNTGNGNISTAALTARTGNSAGTGTNGTQGFVTINNASASGSIVTGAIDTSGAASGTGHGGIGGNVTMIGNGDITVGGALDTSAGTSGTSATSTRAGRNAGNVTISGANTSVSGTIKANGGAGFGLNQTGGNAGAVTITGTGGVTTTSIGASGGAGTTTNANGGNAGSITIHNSGSGNIQTTTLTSQAGNAAGTGTGGTAGNVDVTNTAAGGNISTTTITTAGATNAHGGNVLLSSLGNTTVTGTITTSGGAAAAGGNAGNVTITGVNRSVTGTITANGGAALGTNQAGGNAGAVSITGTGTLNTAAINSRTGDATGTGHGGSLGGITLNGTSVSSGILTTNGGANGNGGDVDVTATTGTLAVGGISATGTTKGNATLLSSGNITQTGAIAVGTLNATTTNNTGANITLLNAGNAVTSVNLQARTGTTAAVGTANASSAVIQYRDADALVVAGINNGTGAGGNVSLTAGDAITQTSAIAATTFTATTLNTSGAAITLDNAGNAVTTLSLSARNAANNANAAGALSYRDTDGFAISNLRTTADATLQNGGAVTQSAAIAAAGLSLLGSGGYTLNTSTNNIATLAANTTNAISYRDANAVSIGSVNGTNGVTTNNTVTLTAGGAITQTQAIATTTLTATTLNTSGAAITLDNAGNAVTTLSLSARNAANNANAAGALSYRDTDGFDISNLRTTADATLQNGGAVTQSAAIAAAGLSLLGSGGYTLNTSTNNIATLAANTTNAISYRDANAVSIGSVNGTNGVTTNNTVTLTAGGAITQTQAITADTLSAKTLNNTGAAITLNNSANDVAIVGLSARNAADSANAAGAISYVDANAFSMQASATTSTLTARALTSNLSVGGALTASKILLQADAGDVTLNSTVTSSSTANDALVITASNGRFINNAGASALNAAGSRWVVYSKNAHDDSFGSLVSGNKAIWGQSNTSRVPTSVAAGNHFVFSDAVLNVTTTNGGKTYGDLGNVATNYSITGDAFTNFSNAYIVETLDSIGNSGAANITSVGTAVTANVAGSPYAINGAIGALINTGGFTYSFVNNGLLTVAARALTVTANAGQTKIYGNADPANFTYTSNAVNGDTFAGALARASGENAGNYAINQGTLDVGTNYSLTYISNDFSIGKRAITVSTGDVIKTYDGTTSAAGVATVTAGNLVGGDSLNGGSFAFTDKNFGINNKTVTVGGVTVSDGNGGGNYDVNFADNTSSTINKANLTIGTSNVTKTYNGSTDMSGATGQGAIVTGGTLFSGDNLSGGTFSYTNKNFGIGNKTVTTSGVTVTDGINTDNYNVSYQNNTTSTINKANLNIDAVTDSKVYDGGVSSAGAVSVGTLFGTDTVTATSQAFDSKNVLGVNGSTLNVTGYTINDDNGGANYNVSSATAAGTITPAALSLNATTDARTYDGGTSSSASATATGLVGGDAVTSLTQSFNSKNVLGANGSTLSINSGYVVDDDNGGANYTVTENTAAGTINKASLNIDAVTDSKVYDGGVSSTGAVSVGTLFGTDTVTATSQAFDSKNVLGPNGSTLNVTGYTINDDNGGANYNVSSATAAGTITPAALSLNAVTETKTYDGTTGSSGVVAEVGLVGGDTVTGLGQSFDSKNVLGANGSTLSINSGYVVDDDNGGANYTVTENTAMGTITPRAISITADAGQTKVYGSVDPIFTFTVGGLGIATGDALSGNLNRATGETVGAYAMSQGSLAVPDASNYIVTYIGNDFNILQPASTTGLPSTTAGLVDLNPKLGAYTGSQLFILSLAPSAAGGDGTSADANLPQCESNPDKLAKDKDFSIMINYGLNLPEGLNNTCI